MRDHGAATGALSRRPLALAAATGTGFDAARGRA